MYINFKFRLEFFKRTSQENICNNKFSTNEALKEINVGKGGIRKMGK